MQISVLPLRKNPFNFLIKLVIAIFLPPTYPVTSVNEVSIENFVHVLFFFLNSRNGPTSPQVTCKRFHQNKRVVILRTPCIFITFHVTLQKSQVIADKELLF